MRWPGDEDIGEILEGKRIVRASWDEKDDDGEYADSEYLVLMFEDGSGVRISAGQGIPPHDVLIDRIAATR